jgi:hypothetical protein
MSETDAVREIAERAWAKCYGGVGNDPADTIEAAIREALVEPLAALEQLRAAAHVGDGKFICPPAFEGAVRAANAALAKWSKPNG